MKDLTLFCMLVFEKLLASSWPLSPKCQCIYLPMRTRQQPHCEVKLEETTVWPMVSIQQTLNGPGKLEIHPHSFSLCSPWGQK